MHVRASGRVHVQAFGMIKGRDDIDRSSFTQLSNAIVGAYRKLGPQEKCIGFTYELQKACDHGTGFNYVAALKACANVAAAKEGRLMHSWIVEGGWESDAYVANALIDMYAKCGSIDDARQVFQQLPKRDVVSWNIMISGFAYDGDGHNSLLSFFQMQNVGIIPNCVTFICVLKACSIIEGLDEAKLIHAYIVESSLELDNIVANTLVDTYAKCRSILNAHKVFDRVPKRDVVTWSAMIAGLCRHNHGEEALELFKRMLYEGIIPNKATFVSILKACAMITALDHGMIIHAELIEVGFELGGPVGNTLLDMYARCGSFEDAHRAFELLSKQDVVSWTVLIENLVSHGFEEDAINIFQQMCLEGVEANEVTFISILKACSSIEALDQGTHIHLYMIQSQVQSDATLENTLIDMYSKCGCVVKAQSVFDRSCNRDVVTWSTMIAGYAQHKYHREALDLFRRMQEAGCQPNRIVYTSILKVCSNISNQDQGKLIHAQIIRHGFESDDFVGISLVNMYAKYGNLELARRAFDKLASRDVVTWSAMITGYAQGMYIKDALLLLQQMQQEGVEPNQVSFVGVLKASSEITALDEGKLIHSNVLECGLESEIHVGNALIYLYVKCGVLEDAQEVFNKLFKRDVVSWTIMIGEYVKCGFFEEALRYLTRMQHEGMKPNHATFISIFRACSTPPAFDLCKAIFAHVVMVGFDSCVPIVNSLINIYGKFGCLLDAHAVFSLASRRDVITWSSMIAVLSEHGHNRDALQLFCRMQLDDIEPNHVTFLSVMRACSNTCALEEGQLLQAYIHESGLDLDSSLGNTLVDMYAKCGSIADAQSTFDKISKRDVVTWSALIEGYSEHHRSIEALHLFKKMLQEAIEPNIVTFVSVLKACISIPAKDQGKIIHAHAIEIDAHLDMNIGSALVDMYSKCGRFKDAYKMFTELPNQNIVTWSSMLAGCAQENDYAMALECFKGMEKQGFQPDGVAFLSILSACTHAGLVNEAVCHFNSMGEHSLEPTSEHYNCIMDLLGRTGRLKEAKVLLETMPFQLDPVGLTSLLGHCKTHGDVKLGRQCFRLLMEADKTNASGYVLMSNAFARADMQGAAGAVEGMRKFANAWKKPGKAFVDIDTDLQDFTVGDMSHSQIVEVYAKLERLNLQLKYKGYLPQLALPLEIIPEENNDSGADCAEPESEFGFQAVLYGQ